VLQYVVNIKPQLHFILISLFGLLQHCNFLSELQTNVSICHVGFPSHSVLIKTNQMQQYAVCDLYYCKITLHVSEVTAPIIRSTKNRNRSLRYRS